MSKTLLYSKLFFGTTLTVFLIFFSWKTSYSYHCLSLIFPLIALLIISYGYIELKMEERACFKQCYFKENTFFSRVLSSRFFVILFYLITSFIMTISIFSSTIDYPKLLWVYLIVHIVLSLFLFSSLNQLFGKMIRRRYQSIFAREWTINIMAIVLMVVFVYLSLNSYEPEYLSDSLQVTVFNASNTVSSNCPLINSTLKLAKTIDSSFWWIVNESAEQTHDLAIKAVIWFAFLFYNSLAILGINRLMIQTIYLLHKIFTKENN